jgi:RNA polymerase sigma-70 factor (ECF subfamily)
VSAEIRDVFAGLPPASRMIVLLVDVENLSYEEVSQVLDCPVGTVSSRLYRARKHLFESLAPFARRQGYLES